ncbi:glycosyltransferase [Paenibacillus alvei]|uniref:Glycosyltransferase n=1 Tax=Paenibacillus alvei TaxID=44250 RepID=A0AAP7DI84_PAEAL|nr:glycosyltransferase [Paenibacillus alvei]NEZ43535.1 glycosyltransferase [Paenibacillus alvei]NOJ70374.1 glycosyltransferase [Paenibacillus alvei]
MNIIQTIYQLLRLEEEAFVTELHRQLLNKEPDLFSLNHYVGLLLSGHSKISLVLQFLCSRELRQLYAREGVRRLQGVSPRVYHRLYHLLTADPAFFIEELYPELLCREMEPEAVKHYKYLLRRGKMRLSIILGVIASPECQMLLSSPQMPRMNGMFEFGEFHIAATLPALTERRYPEARPLRRKVSIVILTWNGLEHTKRCMPSLARYANHQLVDVVVLDNGSSDGTVTYLREFPWIQVIAHDRNIGFTAGNNLAMAHCDLDSDIVLLNNDIIAEQDDWLERLQETAYSERDIGVVGCRLRGEDGLLQHAGTYIFAETCWGQQLGGLEVDIHQYGSVRDVQGVVFACAYVKRGVIDAIGGLDLDYFAYFEDTDYCLRALAAGYRVVYDGRVTLTHTQNASTQANNVDFNEMFLRSQCVFRDKWSHHLEQQYNYRLNWHSIANLSSGYANSSRQMMIALDEQHVKMHYRYVYGPGTPFHTVEPQMSDDYRINVFSMRKRDNAAPEVVYGQGDVFYKNEGRYKIGYTMLEVDGLPQDWVRQCNRMDEVWVPSSFNAETFRNSGVHVPIHIVPLGIDPNYFNPGIRGFRFSEKFTFLSVFEWGERKAPAELLRTFANEFANDDALLICKITNKDPQVDVRAELRRLNLKHVDSKIMIIYNQTIPSYLLGSLYRSVDCFVLPTRGEGWGMPILEAMACGTPVIATDWSAQRDFLNDQTGFPIRVKGMVPAVAKCPYYTGFQWAEPDFEHVASMMRHVYENREAVKERSGEIAQQVLSQWTWSHTAQKIIERLRCI